MVICDNNTRCEHASDYGTSGGKMFKKSVMKEFIDYQIHVKLPFYINACFKNLPVYKAHFSASLVYNNFEILTRTIPFFLLTPSREYDVKATTLRTFFSTMYFCFKYWSFLKRSIEVESEQQHVANGQHQIKSLWWIPCFSTLCQTNANVYVIWNALTYCWSHVNKHTG